MMEAGNWMTTEAALPAMTGGAAFRVFIRETLLAEAFEASKLTSKYQTKRGKL